MSTLYRGFQPIFIKSALIITCNKRLNNTYYFKNIEMLSLYLSND